MASGMRTDLIAPCGMNCRLCWGFLREKNQCPGCRAPAVKWACRIRRCKARKTKFCGGCEGFPCRRLKQLDRRYRTKYGMSMLENLGSIRSRGIRAFVRNEKQRWLCPACGSILCVHRRECPQCGRGKPDVPRPGEAQSP
jgi:hypothetical protein